MSCYGPLASLYDNLTSDVDYTQFADFYESFFCKNNGEFHLLLDLCCGTGTLTKIMTERGYELISVDASESMLMEAAQKASGLSPAPLFLCQDAAELDLYGTVDAAYCSLDGINYIHPGNLPEVFRRLHLFIRPEGLLIFDIKTPEFFSSLDGDVFVDESDDMLCLWRADYDETERAVCYGMDLFTRSGKLWKRESEEHIEYSYKPEELSELLGQYGFTDVVITSECPQSDKNRLFIIAKRSN